MSEAVSSQVVKKISELVANANHQADVMTGFIARTIFQLAELHYRFYSGSPSLRDIRAVEKAHRFALDATVQSLEPYAEVLGQDAWTDLVPHVRSYFEERHAVIVRGLTSPPGERG